MHMCQDLSFNHKKISLYKIRRENDEFQAKQQLVIKCPREIFGFYCWKLRKEKFEWRTPDFLEEKIKIY